ncbi:MAG: hypothetical protein ABH829_01025 [archaeon]
MVYVFGIDMPIMELLLVYAVLSGISLLVLVYEIFKLKSLLLTEKKALTEFETDINRFEAEEKKLEEEERKLAEEEARLAQDEAALEEA